MVNNMSVIYTPKGKAYEYSPLALNIYEGCAHACKYCYAPDIFHRTLDDYQAKVLPRANIMSRIRQEAPRYADNADRPILLSFTSDPYQPLEKELELTRQTINIFRDYAVHYRILTKSSLAARDFDIMENSHSEFGMTMVFLNDRHRQEWEPNASSVMERMNTLIEASRRGIKTWVSLEPVIIPKETLGIIKHLAPYVNRFSLGKLNHHPEIERTIDWADFGVAAVALLRNLGKSFYIKKDLQKHIKITLRPEEITIPSTQKQGGIVKWKTTQMKL